LDFCPLARRYRRIVRRLRRLAQPRFELRHALHQRFDLNSLTRDNISLRQVQRDQLIMRELAKRVTIHRILESRQRSAVNYPGQPFDPPTPTTLIKQLGEQLRKF
jgi:hypothetical protein